ncbi:hypothetical protein CBM2609_A10100 [Cupriavidus taiwanensis]|uniref:Uncharacterized protein n=1 Tax=Cupriavidus taiwanensis TaxID=164546 RepID=A0A976AXZ2_9BURK|nr:hypothetical protein CBM2609_A10100 [Cupriavidus taiwanensis]SOZ41115.1 hypothetical protein CBM2610_A10125 [Cupriavidus taiwanensis]SOZ58561.1 hypothetical protein CBM2615_A380099 [Cupriavidus taiwanensis]SOZ59545.1 hypothetical protein CBM2614_A350099 [Cupriavidus taiwanensis]SOZ62652.1 hypothetical protein CBM2613_A330129 [Cupriavidus taiwanensis]
MADHAPFFLVPAGRLRANLGLLCISAMRNPFTIS